MAKTGRRGLFYLYLIGVFVLLAALQKFEGHIGAFNPFSWTDFEQELPVGQYYTICDTKTKKVIDKTSMAVNKGDTLIAEDNTTYEITRLQGRTAWAASRGKDREIAWNPAWDKWEDNIAAQGRMGKTDAAIYYTHTDESYVPTDGSESLPGRGGIFKVGDSFAEALKAKGINVAESKNKHDPHDANAYERSRRTAMQLLKKNPKTLIDIHRDGVPDAGFYKKTVEGKQVTQVRLVVGRQNPRMSTNLAYAKQLKGYADKKAPGIIKAIFIGKGDYNQDLGPRALLIEVGTHTNSRKDAEKGAAVLADAIPAVLGVSAKASPQQNPLEGDGGAGGSSVWKTIGWIALVVVGGGALFLLISTGSVKNSWKRVSTFGSRELSSFFGIRARRDAAGNYKRKESNKGKESQKKRK